MEEQNIKKILQTFMKNKKEKISVKVMARNELKSYKFKQKYPQIIIVNSSDRYDKWGGRHWLLIMAFSPSCKLNKLKYRKKYR